MDKCPQCKDKLNYNIYLENEYLCFDISCSRLGCELKSEVKLPFHLANNDFNTFGINSNEEIIECDKTESSSDNCSTK